MHRLPRPRNLAAALACSAALLVSLPGCSFALVKRYRPPAEAETNATPAEPPECTSSRAAPIADTVLGAALLATAFVALTNASESCDSQKLFGCFSNGFMEAGAVIAGVPGLVFTASSWYGYAKTGKCAAAKRDFANRNAVSDACDPGDPACVRIPWPPARISARAAADSTSPAWEAEGLR